MKWIPRIWLTILIVVNLAACNTKTLGKSPQDSTKTQIPEQTDSPKLKSPEPEQNPVLQTETLRKTPWHQSSWVPVDEDQFLEDLDIANLEMIARDIQSLVAEIQEKERADPDYVLQGKWNEDFRSSEQYCAVLELGLGAVKPAYYIIYKSPQSGLYEYILASAIDEITGYNYSITEDYDWSNSKQFLEMYNDKVKQTLKSFRAILDNSALNEAEKAEQIRTLGIFAVATLLDEIDSSSPSMPAERFEATFWQIIIDYTGEDPNQNIESWRSEYEQNYRDIIEIME
jgi:hypothetical protein